jgi:ankyrin repeat protein
MPQRSLPTRTLPDSPNLDQLKRQAKELLTAFRDGNADAVKEVRTHYRRADPASFALHDAQLVLARAYGFDSWPKLKAFVDGVTIRRLVDAVVAGDLATVRAMVDARPELVHVDAAENDERRALHHAVLQRHPEIVRFLMQRGADARKGIWPHRSATTAFTLASERGYEEIVRIIESEERRRLGHAQIASAPPPLLAEPTNGFRQAIATGDARWLQARSQEGLLVDGAGLVSHAVAVNRPEMLALLLQSGLDPDESGRVHGLEDVVPTWGEPLRACAISGDLAMAAMLLAHGANPNTNVYAASSALFEAYKKRDDRMIELLERHGARLSPGAAAELGLIEYAARWLAEARDAGPESQAAGHQTDVVWELLWGSAGCPEIVRLVLEAVTWAPDDRRWHGILENGLYLGPESDRARQLEAFGLVLSRADPNVQDQRRTTLLHHVVASRGGLTADDRLVYATLLLDRGARVDLRDDLLASTPLGWACRWGRLEMVGLLLQHGADPVEADAEPWARPVAWARKAGRRDVELILEQAMHREEQ